MLDRRILAFALIMQHGLPAAVAAPHIPTQEAATSSQTFEVGSRGSCKQVSSCEEAVILWCNGYRRADADDDGIPCENVCSSKDEVDQIRAQIGC